jgi:hypothetical protein
MLRSALRWTLRLLLVTMLLVAGGLVWLFSGWGDAAIKRLIVSQANSRLTATLEIDSFGGSLLRGITLRGVRLIRGGETVVAIDEVALSYSIRELYTNGTTIQRLVLTRPKIVGKREADGRWNLASLVRRDPDRPSRPLQRPLRFPDLSIVDGDISLSESLTFGAFHVPSHFADLDARLSFDYSPGAWTLGFTEMNWIGKAPDLTVKSIQGSIANREGQWTLDNLRVVNPVSSVLVKGTIDRRQSPAMLQLSSDATRFEFAEWAGTVPVLSRIATSADFSATIAGPPDRLTIGVKLDSPDGKAEGTVVLNSREGRRQLSGSLDLARFNVGPWFRWEDRPSDITGHARFDLRFEPGSGIPIGTFDLDDADVRFMGYAGDRLTTHGELNRQRVLLGRTTATAYGANLALDAGTIGLSSPYAFTFQGLADGVDLRQVPSQVPVPHVESTLRFVFDVAGQFVQPYIRGGATFRPSEFLGARLGDGFVGSIDTSVTPFTYTGTGDLDDVDVNRFGRDLQIAWMQQPRYAGLVSGRFDVAGTGGPAATLRLASTGHLREAALFEGRLSDAEVSLNLAEGSLDASYEGLLAEINPAVAMADPRFAASLTGSGRARIHVRDLLTRSPALPDYTVDAELTLGPSRLRTVDVTRAMLAARLEQSALNVTEFQMEGPAIELSASGRLEMDETRPSDIRYRVVRADLARLRDELGRTLEGQLSTTGRMTGPLRAPELRGEATLSRLAISGLTALSTSATYDVTGSPDGWSRARFRVSGRMTLAQAFGEALEQIDGTVGYADQEVTADVRLTRTASLAGAITGRARLDFAGRRATLLEFGVGIASSSWRLSSGTAPVIDWDERGVTVRQLTVASASDANQQLSLDGSWRPEGGSRLVVVARNLSLDSLVSDSDGPARYGGTIDVTATIEGSRAEPFVTGEVRVTDGRVFRTPYQLLEGRVDYVGGRMQVNLRLDQAPGIWLTATGSLPASLFRRGEPEGPLDLTIQSSRISLGLIEGATSVVREASGALLLNVRAIGTPSDPHFDGRVAVEDAEFVVAASGTRYKEGQVALRLTRDRVEVETFHLEDSDGDPLDLRGSLGTHELRVGELTIDVRARDFAVLDNDFGTMSLDSDLSLRGQFESPQLTGRLTVTRGAVRVDAILDRTMLQLYDTEPTEILPGDAIAAINPWDRIGLNIDLHVPGTLRFVGDNVQVTPGTPLGLGDFNLRAIGDLNLYKDPHQPMYVTGSLDSVSGTYSFQGRRFELDPSSSINFRGDLQPELYVSVLREISGVETRVTIVGPLSEPELRLSSSPPLEASDILSLIVFNTSTNQLSGAQQEQLAIRAGTLAAGFVAAPLVAALERSLGLETLEIAPSTDGQAGARVTIGNEIAPGLVARFSRQFGETEYDEATLEYYLSRILRIRATFSDASALVPRSPFRRTERAGIDLLFFFSF